MLISFKRFVARKYGLRYSTIVTTFRIGVAIACCWLLVVAYVVSIFVTAPRLIPWPLIYVIVSLLVIMFCHISVYLVSRRHLIQIVSQQVLPEAKAKFLAENKACKTTSIIVGGLFMSYIPGLLAALKFVLSSSGSLTQRLSLSVRPLAFSFYILNLLLFPTIYCVQGTEIRKAALQLLTKQNN